MPRRGRKFELEGYEVKDPARAYLGEGTYGTVFLATEKATGRHVAIKQHHDIIHEDGVPSSVLRETTLLRMLMNSPFVVKMHKSIQVKANKLGQPPTTYMIFEHLDCDLHDYHARHRPLASDIVQRIMYHILLGLHHCHTMGLMHRDLKPHNILLDNSDPLQPITKLADFGFGRSFTMPIQQLTEEIVTLWYRPPEVLLGYEGHSPAVDIWSVACIFGELYQNKVLFNGENEVDQLVKIFHLVGTPGRSEMKMLTKCQYWHEYPIFARQNFSDCMTSMPLDAIDLLDKMLVHDPACRPTSKECLEHPYFASILDKEQLKHHPQLPQSEILIKIPPPTQHANSAPARLPGQNPPLSRYPLSTHTNGSH